MHATCTNRGVYIALRYENLWWYELVTNKESRVYSGVTALKFAYLSSDIGRKSSKQFSGYECSSDIRQAITHAQLWKCHYSVLSYLIHLFPFHPAISTSRPTLTHSLALTHIHAFLNTFHGTLSSVPNQRTKDLCSPYRPLKQSAKCFFHYFNIILYYRYCILLKAETTWIQTQTISVYSSNINITRKNTISCIPQEFVQRHCEECS